MVANDERCGVFVPSADIRDVGQLQRPAVRLDRRSPYLLQVVKRAVQTDVDALIFGVDRSSRGDRVLPDQRRENVFRFNTESRDALVREIDENAFRLLSEESDFLRARNLQNVLSKRLGLPGQQPKRKALRLQ